MSIVAGQDRVNLVPLIDCMFFLILFFLVATRFTPDELAIASLMPTQAAGGRPVGPPPPLPVLPVTIAIVPAGLPRGLQPSQYARLVADRAHADLGRVAVRVGGSAAIEVDAAALTGRAADAATAGELARLDAYLRDELAARELPGADRAHQPQVIVAAYSGLPWSLALAAFDGVRAYERDRSPGGLTDAAALADARGVAFRAPPLRDAAGGGIGDELFDLVHLR